MEDITISSREANQRLSRYLDAAARGQNTVITRRGKPIAKIVPVESARQRALTTEQQDAWNGLAAVFAHGLYEHAEPFNRDDAYER